MIAAPVLYGMPGRTGAAGFHLAAAGIAAGALLDESGAALLEE